MTYASRMSWQMATAQKSATNLDIVFKCTTDIKLVSISTAELLVWKCVDILKDTERNNSVIF